MAVHINKPKPAGGPTSNKPPTGSPDAKAYPHLLVFDDGRVIWRSLPKPDHITIYGYLLPDHFPYLEKQSALPQEVMGLAEGLKGAATITGGSSAFSSSAAPCRSIIPLGPRGATVFVEIKAQALKDPPSKAFTLRLEFNPRKLQAQGHAALIKTITQASNTPFEFGAFLADAKIMRLDVALDFVDIAPDELIATAKNQGKTVEYRGADGLLESIQLHRKRKLPVKPMKRLRNPLGVLAIRIYDRDKERIAHSKPVPLEGHRVTRAEVTKNRFSKPWGLADLPTKAEPFKDVSLSYSAACCPFSENPTLWRRYLACRRSVGAAQAAALLSLTPMSRKAAEKAYDKHASTLLAGLDSTDWHKGLEATGLGHLIALAVKKAVP